MTSRVLDLWEQRTPLTGKNPRAWFEQLTSAFNDSPSILRFSEDDNLDTGNASPEAEPFRPFVDSLLNSLLTDSDPHRRYTQLNAHNQGRDALAQAVRCAFTALGMPNEPSTFACLAYGATQAWEACCRHTIQRPGDVILVPTPTYTLLIPPVMLAQGEVVYIDIGPSGKLSASQLGSVCAEKSSELLQRWLRDLPSLFRLFASKAEVCLTLPDGSLNRFIPKIDDTIRELLGAAVEVNVRGRDTMVTTTLFEHFSFTEDQRAVLAREGIVARYCLPPRAVGLLFLNPTLGGRYYTHSDVKELETVVKQYQLTVIEDLAYTLMPLEVTSLKSIGRFGCLPDCSRLSLTILGLSKPLSVANHRVSVVIAPRRDLIDSVDTFVKSSVAQVASYLYSAVTEALNATESLVQYVTANSADSSFGYKRKLRLALNCLVGVGGDTRQKIEIVQAVAGSGGISPSDPAITAITSNGLSDFLRVTGQPEGGIFLLVDATNAITLLRRSGVRNIESAYDLSIFLAFTLKVRAIPEEAMNGWSHFKAGTLLRMSFSTTTATFARAAIEMYKLFKDIESLDRSVEAIGRSIVSTGLSFNQGRDLTPAEQSMFIEQMQRAKAYTVVSPTRIDGPLDVSLFQDAVDSLVKRHPSLSFSFPFNPANGRPHCTVTAPPARVVVDAIENIKQFVEQDFDITDGVTPLSAFRLFRKGINEHIFLLVQHHIVTDNGSIGILMSELFQLYGNTENHELPSPTGDLMLSLPWSKSDDVLWHADRLATLEDPFPIAGDSITSVDRRMEIDATDHQRIIEIAQGRGTEFEVFMAITAMTLQAAMADLTVAGAPTSFGVLLPASLRLSRDTQLASGFGVNSLVCKVDVPEETPFLEVVSGTAEAVRNCRERISAPLPHVAKHLRENKLERVGEIAIAVRPPPSPSIVKAVPGGEMSWTQVVLDEVRVDGTLHGTSKHPIGFVYSRKATDTFSGFVVDIIVSSAAPAGSADRLLAALRHIVLHLHSGLRASDVEVDSRNINERTFFHPTSTPVVLVPHQIYKFVSQVGLQRALWSPDSSLSITSAEVGHRMLHVCSLVQSKGWKRVAVCLPPGPGSVIAIMGVLAAGASCILRSPSDARSDITLVDGTLVAEGDEEGSPNKLLTPLRRDGALPATVAAPSLPFRILDTLANISPDDIALEYTTGGGTHVAITQAGLRRQFIAWGRVLQFATHGDTAQGQHGEQFSTRVGSCDQAVDTPQYVIQSLVPILLGMQLVITSDLRRIVSLAPPINTVILPRGDILQSATSASLTWSLAGRPIVLGPLPSAEGNAAAELFRKFPHLTAFPVVFAPREVGVVSVSVVTRGGNTAEVASSYGLPCDGAHLTLTPLHSNPADVDVPHGGIGQVVVRASWLNRGVGLRINDAIGATTTYGIVASSSEVTATSHQSASATGLRLAKLSAPSSTAVIGSSEEELVKDLFAQVLEIPKKTLSTSSDFFDVGGDSFTLSQLANRLQAHGAKPTVAVLINKMLRDMTVRGIALLLPVAAVPVQHQDPHSSVTATSCLAGQTTVGQRSRSSSLVAPAVPSVVSKSSLPDDGEVDWENEIYD